LDGGNNGRFTTSPDKLDITKFKSICIDHHPETFEGVTLNLSDPTGSATCQLLAELFDITSFDKPLAETLMIGILGDTGSFRFVDPTRSRVLDTSRKLVDVGQINIQVLQQRFERVPENIFEIMQILMANTKNVTLPNLPGFSYTYLSKSLLSKYDADTMSLAYHKYQFLFIRQIEGYPWGFVVAPKDEKEFKISFRSTPGAPNVKILCNQFFDGGGHVMASGGKYILKEGDIVTDAPEICDFIINTLTSNEIPLNPVE